MVARSDGCCILHNVEDLGADSQVDEFLVCNFLSGVMGVDVMRAVVCRVEVG